MEIEISSIILGMLFLATFFTPIFWYQISARNKIKSETQRFQDIALTEGIRLADFDIWGGGYGIGLDSGSHRILFLNPDHKDGIQIIPLDRIQYCKSFTDNRNVKYGKHTQSVIDRTGLILTMANGQVRLTFYDGTSGKTLLSELNLAQKWSANIKKELQNMSITEKTLNERMKASPEPEPALIPALDLTLAAAVPGN